jgi:RNase P subunit RPR2
MHRRNDTASSQHTSEQLNTPVARSYQEIAEVLSEREGRQISPEEVRELCRGAERKLTDAARADPIIDQWL